MGVDDAWMEVDGVEGQSGCGVELTGDCNGMENGYRRIQDSIIS